MLILFACPRDMGQGGGRLEEGKRGHIYVGIYTRRYAFTISKSTLGKKIFHGKKILSQAVLKLSPPQSGWDEEWRTGEKQVLAAN